MVLRGLTVAVLMAAAPIIAGCDASDDEPEAEEPLGLRNVQPYGDPRTLHPSEVPLPPEEETESGSATDAAEKPDGSTGPHDGPEPDSARPAGGVADRK